MVDPRASRFWLAALQSSLLDVPALNACWEGIPAEKRDAPEHLDRRLARQAVQQNHLTLWQAQQLLAGRTNGFRVDRYLLLDLIGHGGMGRVYLARDTRLGRLVALKILSPERMSNPRAIARFQREARVGAQLQHENLVRIYDFGDSQGRYFLVMEFIEGKTIGALINEQGPMPPATAARLTRQIALGLEHAHRKGLIHRDVNPFNILVTHEGIAKLADLGLAIDLAEEDRVTREGATVGTFDYVAPEQARHSHSADIRSDIYSLGCTLYHMIAGQVPFPSPSLPEKLFAHQALEPRALDQVVPDVPAGLVDIVRRMMRKQPDERFATPLQVAQALEPYVEEYARLHDSQPEPNPLIGEEPTDVPGGPIAPLTGPSEFLPALGQASPDRLAAANLRAGPGNVVAPSVLTPVNDHDVNSSEDVPLILDLGPEPPLIESVNRARSWFGTEKAVSPLASASDDPSGHGPAPGSALEALLSRHPWIWPWGPLALLLMVLLVVLGFLLAGPSGNDQEKRPPVTAPDPRAAPKAASKSPPQAKAEPTGPSQPAPAPPADLTVVGEDGREEPAASLQDAIGRALGSKGWVVFRNRRPLRLLASPVAAYAAHTGALKLRSADGVAPVLEVELGPGQSFLKSGSGVSLFLQGLTLVVRTPPRDPGAASSKAASTKAAAPAVTPVLETAGKAELHHCTIAFEGQDDGESSAVRAIIAKGGDLTVKNCWFRGFDTPVVLHATRGMTAQFEQTLVTSARYRDPARPAAGGSLARTDWPAGGPTNWLFRVELMGGGRAGAPRKLVFDHCTVVGDGLVELADFTPSSPIRIEARGCAFQTRSLIGWRPSPDRAVGGPKAIEWTGQGNLLDVRGPAWIEASAKSPTEPGPPIGDFKAWSALMKEVEPVAGRIDFPARPPGGPEGPRPDEAAVEANGPGKVGADPQQVGPERISTAPATG